MEDEEREDHDLTLVLKASAWRELLAYLRPYRWTVAAGGVLSLVGGAIGLLEPLVTKKLIDSLEQGGSVLNLVLLLTVAVLAGAVLNMLGAYLLGRSSESVVRDSRIGLVTRMLRLRMKETGRFPPGNLMSRVSSDTTLMHEVVSEALINSIKGVLMTVGILVMMVLMAPTLVLVTVGVLIACGILIGILLPLNTRYNIRVQESVAEINTTMERALGAFRTIKAAGIEREEEGKAADASNRAFRAGLKLALLNGGIASIAMLAIHISFLAVLGIGGARVASGDIQVGTLVAFLLYLFYLLDPVTELIEAAASFSAGVAAVRRIREVHDLEVEPATEPGPRPLHRTPVSVRFDEVVFRYPDTEAKVHHGVSFDIPARGMTAFVGPSGAGKSTVFALLERFYEPESGRILIDGVDTRELPLDRLRAQIGYVEQDAPVLAGTLRENLLIGVPEACADDIARVLTSTRLDSLVARLPDGVDTAVGHRGNTLSGGERQRVAVARALLRRPRLLLLDEVTSQLDAVNELALREVIVEASREVTVLVVAHRLSTVIQADRIVVMDAGRVRAVGTHEELIEMDTLYRELATTQLLTAEDAGNGVQIGQH